MAVCFCSSSLRLPLSSCPFFFFFFNDTATTEIYTLSLHDALPILTAEWNAGIVLNDGGAVGEQKIAHRGEIAGDRKSTRLNSSHANISYAVFCLKKKKKNLSEFHNVDRRFTAISSMTRQVSSLVP